MYVYVKSLSRKKAEDYVRCRRRAIIATSVKSIVWKMTGFDKSFVGFARACFFSSAFCSRPRSDGGREGWGGGLWVAEVCHLKSLSCRVQFDRKYYNKVLYHLAEKLCRETVPSSREFNTQTSSARCKLYTFRNFILVLCTYYIVFRKVYTAEGFERTSRSPRGDVSASPLSIVNNNICPIIVATMKRIL